MNGELDMAWKEAAVACLMYYTDISIDGRKPLRTLISTAGLSAKFRTLALSTTKEER